MNVLSLFSGIGGLDLGLERAGMKVVGQVEIDPFCQAVLAKHWPEAPRHDDVRSTIQWWRSGPRPHVDVVAGGYPCQPESVAGKRRGVDDQRWLWPEMARVVAAIRPRYVIGENVLGHRARGLRFVIRDLERLGYTARAGTLAASEVGAPHRRRRIFIIADLADAHGEPGRSRRPGDPGQGAGGRDVGAGGGAGHVADTDGPGRGPGRRQQHAGQAAERTGWWATEPALGRVAHGVPGRVDRLRGLGNAVVPQVAEVIGRIVMGMAA